jgi:hypothetical protein
MFEDFTAKELLHWTGGILLAAAIIIFCAIWATDAFLDANAPEGATEMSRE